MKYKNVKMINMEKEELADMLNDVITRIQEIREEIIYELDDLENTIAEIQ